MLPNLFHEGKASPVGRIVSDCATRNPPSVSRSGGFWCALGNGGCGASLLSSPERSTQRCAIRALWAALNC